jgi:serine/threonine-protein kinase SRPK3
MFDGRDPTAKYSNRYHLAEMVALMGPPPLEFLQRSEESWNYFDRQGSHFLAEINMWQRYT